jgi:hypothetical protein
MQGASANEQGYADPRSVSGVAQVESRVIHYLLFIERKLSNSSTVKPDGHVARTTSLDMGRDERSGPTLRVKISRSLLRILNHNVSDVAVMVIHPSNEGSNAWEMEDCKVHVPLTGRVDFEFSGNTNTGNTSVLLRDSHFRVFP